MNYELSETEVQNILKNLLGTYFIFEFAFKSHLPQLGEILNIGWSESFRSDDVPTLIFQRIVEHDLIPN